MDNDFTVAAVIELHEKEALPLAEYELSIGYRHGLACTEEKVFAVRVPVRALTVRGKGVRVTIVGVIVVRRGHLLKHFFHVFDQVRLALIDANSGGGVLREYDREAVLKTGLFGCFFDGVGNVDELRAFFSPDFERSREELHTGDSSFGAI
jgi:hypothetical protein